MFSVGGVAQLGDRLIRNQKAVSSILITSTILEGQWARRSPAARTHTLALRTSFLCNARE